MASKRLYMNYESPLVLNSAIFVSGSLSPIVQLAYFEYVSVLKLFKAVSRLTPIRRDVLVHNQTQPRLDVLLDFKLSSYL